MRSRSFVALSLTAALGIGVVACGDDGDGGQTAATSATTVAPRSGDTAAPAAAGITAASQLRTDLNLLLEQHVILAAEATDAALAGRTAEFDAAVAALDANSVAISEAVGSVYGDAAGEAFLPLWRKHIGFFVDYTTAVGGGDTAGAEAAVADLTAYADEFAAFLNSANPDLPKDVVSELVIEHVLTLKAVVDAQASGDPAAAATALDEAVGHMHMIADPLAGAIVAQFPDEFPGDPTSAAADLQVGLNTLLAQHVAYAAAATDAALAGRTAEYDAMVALLDTNSVAISEAVGSVYGDAAGEAFLPLWRKHIGFFVDYTTAVGGGDTAGAEAAVADLTAYADEFAAFLNSANPDLPKDVVSELVIEHVLTLKAVVDAQAAGDPAAAYTAMVEAMAHMHMIADPLTEAIVAQFPEQFAS